MKYSFLDDYSEGCPARILEVMSQTNREQQTSYGLDNYSIAARAALREHLQDSQAEVFFIASGTLANLIALSSMMRPYEAVVSAKSGHIALRETGAIEATGHTIITLPSADGKLTVQDIQTALDTYSHAPHMVKPKVVYISNATEFGTVYRLAELEAISTFCRQNNLYLFVDGARLGMALCCLDSDVTMADMARLADIFTVGGTKNGALLGEAIVITNDALKTDFAFNIKQRGGLMAKGRVMGIQFLELFRDGLYFELAATANLHAKTLSDALQSQGYQLSAQTETNQIFAILPNETVARLQESFSFYVWGRHDDHHSVVRFVTSWATDAAQVERLISLL